MRYTTQMEAARKGILTPQMKLVAEKEQFDEKELMELVAQGRIAIPANRNHKCLEANGIGSMLKTKINVNLGTSRDCRDLNMELEKVNDAVKMGAESIMDLSSWGDTQKFRRKLTAECPAIIGTVPIYDAVVYYHKPLKEITSEEWIKIVEMHAEDGVDFMTIHVGINRQTADHLQGRALLCAGSAGDGHCARLRPHHSGYRSGLPVLCDPGRASAPSGCIRCKRGYYCFQDCGPCGGYCQGNQRGKGLGLQNEHGQKEAGLGGNVCRGH